MSGDRLLQPFRQHALERRAGLVGTGDVELQIRPRSHLALHGLDGALQVCLGLVVGLPLVARRRRPTRSRVADLCPVHLLQRNDLVQDRSECLGVLLVHDRNQGGRVVLQLAKDRRQQQLADLESLVRLVPQLDQLENTMGLISETREGHTSRRPHHRDVVS